MRNSCLLFCINISLPSTKWSSPAGFGESLELRTTFFEVEKPLDCYGGNRPLLPALKNSCLLYETPGWMGENTMDTIAEFTKCNGDKSLPRNPPPKSPAGGRLPANAKIGAPYGGTCRRRLTIAEKSTVVYYRYTH